MRKRIVFALVAAMTMSTPSQSRDRWDGWRVVRSDYVEFCNANVAAVDLSSGALRGTIGGCAPSPNGPTQTVEAAVSAADLDDLRNLLFHSKHDGFIDPACVRARAGAPKPVLVLSGPVFFSIEHHGITDVVDARSPCLTDKGGDLYRLMIRATEPLRAFGFR